MFRIARVIWLLQLLLLLDPKFSNAEPLNKQLTIFAEAGRQECFYQPIATTESIKIDYQVIHGGLGETHINFNLMDPSRRLLITEIKREMGKHSMQANETVAPADREERELRDLRQEMLTDYHFDVAYTGIDSYMGKIHVNLMRSRQTQDFIRASEARDRNLAESTNSMVNKWSWAQFLSMIFVGFLQVLMVRSIFNTTGRFYTFWKSF
ncbi:transmembrane emp24 domain-containing protein 1 isoform X2 [Drosophila sechellia]|uniref:transmembrane emp24 domain-containing protein 1 isoform X2 n=1 Tax=Drosophila sechellia TaxID=7238 RepID=UPI0013DE1834|nr:transmembrane emp24 domain-containing protein 1 isoform X2 [Drosophila sechellia]